MLTNVMFWAILGIALMIVEIFTNTFIVLFLGIGGLLTSLVVKIFGIQHLPTEMILFSAFGLLQIFFLRKKVQAVFFSKKDIPVNLEETQIVLSQDVPAHGEALIQFQGTVWTAVNDSDIDLKKNERVMIARIEGIKLVLKDIQ